MPAIDLLLRTGLDSERFYQLVLVSLLSHTTLPELLRPRGRQRARHDERGEHGGEQH